MDPGQDDIRGEIETLRPCQYSNQIQIPIAPSRNFCDQLRLSLTGMDGRDAPAVCAEMLKRQPKGKTKRLLVIVSNTLQVISQLIQKTPERGTFCRRLAFVYWFHSLNGDCCPFRVIREIREPYSSDRGIYHITFEILTVQNARDFDPPTFLPHVG
jgi:hypothetical protein